MNEKFPFLFFVLYGFIYHADDENISNMCEKEEILSSIFFYFKWKIFHCFFFGFPEGLSICSTKKAFCCCCSYDWLWLAVN